jgi:uncharacterized protein (UPF0332 family)
LALFLKTGINIKTSKHIGIISLFDKEFIQVKKIDKRYSKILHRIFNIRQEGDYKEFVDISVEDAVGYVNLAKGFLDCIKNYVSKIPA